MELFKVFGQGSISQVPGRCPAESAKLIMRRLKAGMEEGRVKVVSAGQQTLSQTLSAKFLAILSNSYV